jgi:hypothetical protein
MSRFEPHFLDDIRKRLKITEVVGKHVIWDKKKSQPGRGDMWACCPFHGEKGPSFHADDKRGIYHCFGCGVSGDHFRFLTEKTGISFPQAVEELAREAGVEMPNDHRRREQTPEERAAWEADQEQRRRVHAEAQAKVSAAEEKKKQRKVDTAQSIFAESKPIAGTPAEKYLINRGLPPVAEWPWQPDAVLRFHPGLEYELGSVWEGDRKVKPGPTYPVLVAAVFDSWSEVVAIWRIFLTPDGKKAPVDNAKVGFGPAAGGAVRLGGDGEAIGVGEGIETCLSAWFLNGCHKPVWACLSTSGLVGFEIPSFVKRLEIFPDGDRAKAREDRDGKFAMSERPGMAAAKGLEAEAIPILGRENVSIAPEPGLKQDYNDLYIHMKSKGLL